MRLGKGLRTMSKEKAFIQNFVGVCELKSESTKHPHNVTPAINLANVFPSQCAPWSAALNGCFKPILLTDRGDLNKIFRRRLGGGGGGSSGAEDENRTASVYGSLKCKHKRGSPPADRAGRAGFRRDEAERARHGVAIWWWHLGGFANKRTKTKTGRRKPKPRLIVSRWRWPKHRGRCEVVQTPGGSGADGRALAYYVVYAVHRSCFFGRKSTLYEKS